jgi:hypothetical protein
MPEKQLNHYIPRLILKHWEKPITGNRFGVSVYDIKKQRFFIGESRGRKAYSFAIIKNLYVPVIDDSRRIELEDWFSGLEGTLATAIRGYTDSQLPAFTDLTGVGKFLMAIFSFKYRTRSFIEHVMKFLEDNPTIKTGHDAAKSVLLIALENIINAVRNDVAAHSGCDIMVYKSAMASFIVSDSPYLDNITDGLSLLVLSNKLLLAIKKNNLGHLRFNISPCSDDFVQTSNKLIAEHAQYWLVGESQEHLEPYKTQADQPYHVTIHYSPVDHLATGFYFN